MAQVPATPEVLRWAVRESGIPFEELVAAFGSGFEGWLSGEKMPTTTELRKFAKKLRRPFETFLLPAPPASSSPAVTFRHPHQSDRTELNAEERRFIREAVRQQQILAWLVEELSLELPRFPKLAIRANPEEAGPALRELLGVSTQAQREFPTPARAFQGWLQAVEDRGVFVFRFAMGKDSCRAFSIWDDRAPVIAINTAWRPEARIFSLMHELGHLTTRTSSACLEGGLRDKSDPTERWCEQFAAALLLPLDSVKESLRTESSPGSKVEIQSAVRLAKRYRVSVPAAALRLIEAELADWDLYESIPKNIDDKIGFGRSTEPRVRARIRHEQFGRRATTLYLQALEADVLGRTDLVNYLDVADDDIERLRSAAS